MIKDHHLLDPMTPKNTHKKLIRDKEQREKSSDCRSTEQVLQLQELKPPLSKLSKFASRANKDKIAREKYSNTDELDWENAETLQANKFTAIRSPRLKEKLSNVIVKRRIFINSRGSIGSK